MPPRSFGAQRVRRGVAAPGQATGQDRRQSKRSKSRGAATDRGAAERLERGGRPAPAEARRQLADEKDRLANCVDELGRSIAMERRHRQRAPAILGEDLAQIARRMGESARQLREGLARRHRHRSTRARSRASGRGRHRTAAVERRPGSRAAVKEACGTRAIRDRLERLEQQMRAAAAAGPAPGGRDAGVRVVRAVAPPEPIPPRPTHAARPRTTGGNSKRPGRRSTSSPAWRQPAGPAERRQNVNSSADRPRAQRPSSRTAVTGHRCGEMWTSRSTATRLAYRRPLRARRPADRLSSGGSERVPDGYEESIARYFESLAAAKRGKQ